MQGGESGADVVSALSCSKQAVERWAGTLPRTNQMEMAPTWSTTAYQQMNDGFIRAMLRAADAPCSSRQMKRSARNQAPATQFF